MHWLHYRRIGWFAQTNAFEHSHSPNELEYANSILSCVWCHVSRITVIRNRWCWWCQCLYFRQRWSARLRCNRVRFHWSKRNWEGFLIKINWLFLDVIICCCLILYCFNHLLWFVAVSYRPVSMYMWILFSSLLLSSSHFFCIVTENIQCLYNSMGAALVATDRHKFDRFVKKIMRKKAINDTKESPAKANECPTSKETLYDYFFDRSASVWLAWDWMQPSYTHNTSSNYDEFFVPTASTMRFEYILKLLSNVTTIFRPFLVWTSRFQK